MPEPSPSVPPTATAASLRGPSNSPIPKTVAPAALVPEAGAAFRTAQGLAQIDPDTVSGSGYPIDFYASSAVGPKGVSRYPVSGTRLTSWAIVTTNDNSGTYLVVTETPTGGSSRTSVYEWVHDNTYGDGWRLTRSSSLGLEQSFTSWLTK